MAFVAKGKKDRFEIRESHSTPDGPRSRTLASFKELDDEAIEKARARARNPLDAAELRASALRAGAPIAARPVDGAARSLLGKLAKGERPDPMLKRLLLDALTDEDLRDRPRDHAAAVSDSARSVREWIGVDAAERGRALEDLLLLADALPLRRRPDKTAFPRLRSA